ncbi:hypothetical protein Hanom_Chr16g01516371 [Helianthus anomalus]
MLGEFKRGLDVAHGDWFDVREGTHLLGEHPLHPYMDQLDKRKHDRKGPNFIFFERKGPNFK